jgi:hypothetical protein
MFSFTEYFLIQEAFDTVSDFLLNPEHRDKTFKEVVQEFEATGGKLEGRGTYGKVFSHPQWPYVIKMFTWDDPYLRFARFAYSNPHPSFPKFYGPPKRVVPFFKRYNDDAKIYITRVEKLETPDHDVLEFEDHRTMVNNITKANLYFHYKRYPNALNNFTRVQFLQLSSWVKSLSKEMYNLYEGMSMILRHPNLGKPEIHPGNIMIRPSDGQYIWADPVWEGNEPEDENRNRDDGYSDWLGQPTLIGGKLPKDKKIRNYGVHGLVPLSGLLTPRL